MFTLNKVYNFENLTSKAKIFHNFLFQDIVKLQISQAMLSTKNLTFLLFPSFPWQIPDISRSTQWWAVSLWQLIQWLSLLSACWYPEILPVSWIRYLMNISHHQDIFKPLYHVPNSCLRREPLLPHPIEHQVVPVCSVKLPQLLLQSLHLDRERSWH